AGWWLRSGGGAPTTIHWGLIGSAEPKSSRSPGVPLTSGSARPSSAVERRKRYTAPPFGAAVLSNGAPMATVSPSTAIAAPKKSPAVGVGLRKVTRRGKPSLWVKSKTAPVSLVPSSRAPTRRSLWPARPPGEPHRTAGPRTGPPHPRPALHRIAPVGPPPLTALGAGLRRRADQRSAIEDRARAAEA